MRIQKAMVGARSRVHGGGGLEANPPSRKNDFFRLKWRDLVNSERDLWKIWGQFAVASPAPNYGDSPPVSP